MRPPSLGERVANDFTWGVATSALQIEGAQDRDGRGRSIWEDFEARPGAIAGGDTSAAGSHHYGHVDEDVALMSQLGVDAYRFSVAWPRVLPDGVGEVNPAGLDFYDRLVDRLLAAGIEPWVTLYHWDLPSALQARGGWTRRSTGEAFARYARIVAHRLGDRVTNWITHNEPRVVSLVANAEGVHAPGVTDITTALQVAHEVLVSHGMATHELREAVPRARVGITLDVNVFAPLDPDDPTHVRAATLADGQHNRWFLDPVTGRGYPEDVVAFYGDANPDIRPGDLDRIAARTDFLGLNYYRRDTVVPAEDGDWRAGVHAPPSGAPLTAMGWEIHPDGIHEIVQRAATRYGVESIYVTENGAAYEDPPVRDGTIEDTDRVAYLEAHLGSVDRCRAEGLPLHGYFLWSLLDNFEWAEGYGRRFGIVHSDADRYVRVPKHSFHRYKEAIASRR